MGSLFTFFAINEAIKKNQGLVNTESSCKILNSTIQLEIDNESPFKLLVSYYLNGKFNYYGAFSKSYSKFSYAKSKKDHFKTNNIVKCYYNPKDLSKTTLEKFNAGSILFVLFPLIFVFIGAGGIYFTLSNKQSKKSKVSNSPNVVTLSNRTKLIICSVLLGISVAVTYFLVYKPFSLSIASKNWQKIEAQVLKSEIKENQSDDGTTYAPNILYKYNLNNEIFYSTRISFFDYSSSNYKRAKNIINKYPLGSNIEILVNPNNSVQAVIEPKISMLLLLFLLIPFILIWVAYSIFKSKKINYKNFKNQNLSNKNTTWLNGKMNLVKNSQNLYKLRSNQNLKLTLIFTGLFSILFATFIYKLLIEKDFIPLIIVGIFFIIVFPIFINSLFQIFNPRLSLTIEEENLSLGGNYKFYWKLERTNKKINQISFNLNLEESITYKSGKNSVTKNENVYNKNFFTLNNIRSKNNFGEFIISVPSNLMPSFYTYGNKLTWSIIAKIDIENYPDINQNFEILVRPK